MATTFTNPLDSIKIASPCKANWDEMVGNNRERFCGECQLNVYNLSGMTKRDAESLLMNSEGRLCARFFRRKDGTIITKDCPVGWQAAKQRLSKMWTAIASVLITAVSGIGITAFMTQKSEPEIMGVIRAENPETSQHSSEPLVGKIAFEPEEIMDDIAYEGTSNSSFEKGRITTMGTVAVPTK